MNLAVLCGNCHSKIHLGNLKVFGVLPSTDPSGFILIYELNGVKNIDVDVPNFVKKPKEMKVFYGREDGKTPGNQAIGRAYQAGNLFLQIIRRAFYHVFALWKPIENKEKGTGNTHTENRFNAKTPREAVRS